MSDIAIIEGYASLFNVADGGGDTVLPGAFSRSLGRRGAKGVRFLFHHDPAQPIGRWLELKETRKGLYCKGEVNLRVARGQELAALVEEGGIDGLSIGFRTISASKTNKSPGRFLKQVDLWEISLVTFPMLAGARVTGFDRAVLPAASEPDALAAGRQAASRMARAAEQLDMSNFTRN